MNKLSPEDSDLFFDIFFPLLDFVNHRHKIVPSIENMVRTKEEKGFLNPIDLMKISLKLWENADNEIDEYIQAATFNDGHSSRNNDAGSRVAERIEILNSWKQNRISDKFFVERHLKSGSIFISGANAVYNVKGLQSSWEEMLWYSKLPTMLDATLIPFKGVIISDGLAKLSRIIFGPGIRADLKRIYMTAKKNGQIKTAL